jgi:hypothetical protein
MKLLVCVATATLLVLGPLAQAATFSDPDDMTSPIDVRRVEFTDRGGQIATIKVGTDDGWSCSYFEPGLTTMKWLFDGRGDNGIDLVGKVRCLKFQGGRDLVIFLSGKESGNSYEPVPLKKPNHHSMKATFSFDLPELSGRHVDMRVKVSDGVAEGCTSAHPCTERAPDSGMYRLY